MRMIEVNGRGQKVLWQQMRRTELEEASREGAMVIVPVGSTEQHGPHLPVDTDIHIAQEIALAVARGMDGFRVLVGPPVWCGLSPYHMSFVGTLTLQFQTFSDLIVDLCSSIVAHGFSKIVLLNGHGGNGALLNATIIRLSGLKATVAAVTYWQLIVDELRAIGESELGGVGHACEMETSLELYLRPELVAKELMVEELRVPSTSFAGKDFRAPGAVWYVEANRKPSAHGVYGDPTLASATKGERIFKAVVGKLGGFLREFQQL